ncbi:MAG: Crp/Fnr family transcriptional regulator [Sphingomonadaceae bacterium]|nr:Crp/Fnr family transcriptional regulator [Sphingomonadaceae bacterium]
MAGPQDNREAFKLLLPPSLADSLADHARFMQLKSGQILMGHQDTTTDVFLVLEGTLRVELQSMNGREITLANVGEGDIVGEFAALDDQPRSASVMASSKCTLARIPGGLFRDNVLRDPKAAEWIAQRLVGQIRQLTERIFELNALAVRSRLHCELLRLSLDSGVTDNVATISPAPTHVQFSSMIGTHREAVTRELQYLHKQGISQQEGRVLTVCDVAKLAEIVRAVAGDVELIQRANQANIGRSLD